MDIFTIRLHPVKGDLLTFIFIRHGIQGIDRKFFRIFIVRSGIRIIFQKRNLEVRQVYDLGALIRSLRKERKITQKKLGEMLDVTEGTISKYEANTMTPPFETLRSIASIFNV